MPCCPRFGPLVQYVLWVKILKSDKELIFVSSFMITFFLRHVLCFLTPVTSHTCLSCVGLKIDWIKAASEDQSVKVTVEYGTEGKSHDSLLFINGSAAHSQKSRWIVKRHFISCAFYKLPFQLHYAQMRELSLNARKGIGHPKMKSLSFSHPLVITCILC